MLKNRNTIGPSYLTSDYKKNEITYQLSGYDSCALVFTKHYSQEQR